MKQKRTVALDVDGVIRNELTGEPITGSLYGIKWLEEKGYKIVIMSASKDRKGTQQWLIDHGLKYKLRKYPGATIYFNNRAVRFINWNDLTSYL